MKNRSREALQLRAVEDALTHYSLDGDNLQAALEALQHVVATDKVVLYDLLQRAASDDLMIGREVVVSFEPGSWRGASDEYLAGRGTNWGAYNPVRPEAAQRDRVLSAAEVITLTEGRSVPAAEFVYGRLGVRGFDTLRVLVCDGPSMLGWLGVLQPERTTERQRATLARLVPTFRKRLVFERLVRESSVTTGGLAAAFEQINAPAWLLGPGGQIAHANAAAKARFDADPAAVRVELAACAAGIAAPRFKVTPLRGADRSNAGHLVVETPDVGSRVVTEAGRRFNLTPAQTRVFERVARGASNATIAAELKVAERTVEAHVTAILVKAQVASRSALIVQIYAESGRPAAR
jgi:DNA-binding CsgD family transcriptional regulator/PAS domain-containing protein